MTKTNTAAAAKQTYANMTPAQLVAAQAELTAMQAAIAATQPKVQKAAIAACVADVKAALKKHGVEFADVRRMMQPRKNSKNSVTFTNPADDSQTWSGRGRKPAWFKALEESGIDLETIKS